jgi:heat shock protein HslJ
MQGNRPLSWLLLLPLVLLVACGGDTETGETPSSPTLAELKSATYQGLEGDAPSVTLIDGAWEGEPFVEGGASAPRVTFVRDFHLLGDLDGDGAEEAVVLLSESSGGSGEFIYLAIIDRREGKLENIATAAVGDRVQVRAGWIEGDRVLLSVIQAGPEDAACCPGELATRGWALLADGTLEVLPPDAETERLSLEAIGEIKWVLREWSWGESAPMEPEISLVYQDGRLAGSAGCNNYFGSVQDTGSPGEVNLGPVGSTQMACPEEVMAAESRFLEQLGGVKQYGFMAGQLALSYVQDGDWGVMLFEAREPDLDQGADE